MKKTLTLLLAALGLMSCDEENTIYYKLSNQTADSLWVAFTYKDNYFDNQITDTTLVLPPASASTIFEATIWGPSVYRPDGDTMTFFENMTIQNRNPEDTLLIDVYKSSNWRYRETSDHAAEYLLDLKEEHFGEQ